MATADEETPSKPKRPAPGWAAWLADPRTAVLGFLASALLFGGGRKVSRGSGPGGRSRRWTSPTPSPRRSRRRPSTAGPA